MGTHIYCGAARDHQQSDHDSRTLPADPTDELVIAREASERLPLLDDEALCGPLKACP
jgi:hypothetical protein